MSPAPRVIDPQFLTAAALAWTVFNPAEVKKQGNSHHDKDCFDSIPEIDAPSPTLSTPNKTMVPHLIPSSSASSSPASSTGRVSPPVVSRRIKPSPENLYSSRNPSPSIRGGGTPNKRTVVPVVIPSSNASITAPSVTPSPPQVRVSAATMRNIQSRRRVRSAMEHYQQKPKTGDLYHASPVHKAPPSVIMTTPSPATQADMSHYQDEEPESLIRFKAKSVTTNAVIRFQCEPTFEAVHHQVQEKLQLSAATKFCIMFTDVDGDECVMDCDENVSDAICASQKDTMVRLTVQEETKSIFQSLEEESNKLFNSISITFGW